MSFQQGLSGLNAAAKSLDVIGNNIANTSTVGFKASTAQFADVYASSLTGAGASAIGIGTKLAAVTQQFTQGNLTTTNNPLDIAINGGGFFRMSENGIVSFSRNGQFMVDKDGYVTNTQGLKATGYQADANGNVVASAPVEIQLSTSDIAPRTTSTATAVLNVDSRQAPPVTATFDPADPTSFNNTTSLSVYDSLGNPHVVSYYFVKTATANEWSMYATVDGTATSNVDLGGGAGVAATVTFNTAGQLTTAMPFTATIDLDQVSTDLGLVNGATSPLGFTVDLRGSTQFGSPFGVNALTQNGYTAGRLAGLSVGQDGVIAGRYSNGQSRDLAQLVLASFSNAQGLKPIGNNLWTETADSGPAQVGVPGSAALGALTPAAVEDSNVDLTAELVNMITMQRAYQANAQTIKTQDSLMQIIVNLR
jgi:flagellar hook protein FlgE